MPTYIPPPAGLPSGSSVWAYLRDSGGPSQGESIERQRSELQAYCVHYGLRLIEFFVDEARSGGSITGRDDFDRLISASFEKDRPQGLLIWDYARFSRSLEESDYFKAVLRKNKIIIHSITDAIPDGPWSHVVEKIIDIANEEKRRQVSKDTKSGLKRIVETYGAMPGPVPRGYKKERIDAGLRRDGSPHILHRWIPDPEVAPLVLKAFELRAAGKTLKQIRDATHLFTSKNSYTTFFNNSVYKGEAFFSGNTYPVIPIVSKELWEAVQKMGELRSRARYGQHSRLCAGSSHLLSGLLYCLECKAPLYGYRLMDARPYYVCSRARRRDDCHARHIPAKAIEDGLIHVALTELLLPDNLTRLQEAIQKQWERYEQERQGERAGQEKKYSQLLKKIRHYTEAIGNNGPSQALLEALKAAERERDRIEYEWAHSKIQPVNIEPLELEEIASQLQEKLISGDFETRKAALNIIYSKVWVSRGDDQIKALIEFKLLNANIPP